MPKNRDRREHPHPRKSPALTDSGRSIVTCDGPTLQWLGKAEHRQKAESVALQVEERVSTQAILRAVDRDEAQRNLFSDVELPESKVIEFYRHDSSSANRLVLGDSLRVMNSLIHCEGMTGKVQCCYVDPPYSPNLGPGLQASLGGTQRADDNSPTSEEVAAFRETWNRGIHSYLTYLRDRLLLVRELLNQSGSVFLQISDENVHHLREVMDEVFGAKNFCGQIVVQRARGAPRTGLSSVTDYLLWYAKSKDAHKCRPLLRRKDFGIEDVVGAGYMHVESPGGKVRRPLSPKERDNPRAIPTGWRQYRLDSLVSVGPQQHAAAPFEFEGEAFHPGKGLRWKTTIEGLRRLAACRRIAKVGRALRYIRYFDDFPARELTNVWDDVPGAAERTYVAQTSRSVIERAILMTSDPGDLVLDPTCGSGTTAVVAEQWGRRWLTCDISRIAVSISRQRLITAKYPNYRLVSGNVYDGFVYETLPHVTLRSIVSNAQLDECKNLTECLRLLKEATEHKVLYDRPREDRGHARVSGPFTIEVVPGGPTSGIHTSPIAAVEPSALRPAPEQSLRVFISYSHKDTLLKQRLIEHLKVLVRFANLDVWSDDRIEHGADFRAEIERELQQADVALLLISSAFFGSSYIMDKEVPRLLKRATDGTLRLLPIILRPCAWQQDPRIGRLKVLPYDGRAITKYRIRDEGFAEVVQAVAALVHGPPVNEGGKRRDYGDERARRRPDLNK